MRSGDPCSERGCNGRLHVANSVRSGSSQLQYLACALCGKRPSDNVVIVPAEQIRRRNHA